MQTTSVFPKGAIQTENETEFTAYSRHASQIDLCLFDKTGEKETARLPMVRGEDDIHRLIVADVGLGTRYGFRAHGIYAPEHGLWFDPAKLLLDPYATEIDRPFRHDPALYAFGAETGEIMPKAVLSQYEPVKRHQPHFAEGGLIYELAVKSFTQLHPEVPKDIRGTVAALAHPAILAHLKKIGVDAVELMPITAWIDERHLPPLGLSNAWGYNPVGFMALDPRLCPGGVRELRDTVAALHAEGIGVILDLVFNHTGESDIEGSILSLRGLDNLTAFRHPQGKPGVLVNDTGTGNTVACDHPYIRQLIVDSLRHFVLNAGVDGFRFDLAPVLGRTAAGFDMASETLAAMHSDPALYDRILIAEPWDIGPGGYQLGNFPESFLEWNDRARDDMRRFWRGDAGTTGALANALSGSSPIFSRHGRARSRSVNFLAAHDGFTLFDLVSHERKHNERNGESNRDGHNDNHSWNNGFEGLTDDPAIVAARLADVKALLSTLFVSRGALMLTAGDEGGRSQQGNNNAYCQDNEINWVDWSSLVPELIDHAAFLAALRKRFGVFSETGFFSGRGDVTWLAPAGEPMTTADWERPDAQAFAMLLSTPDRETGEDTELAVLINRGREIVPFTLPGDGWRAIGTDFGNPAFLPARSVVFYLRS
ncbi:glycogen debranching protein GlgX [Agrobacterium tumefaciens]|uniref:Glycogen debranching protein GlgX n=1 Tax=Agrobacterium tumefaciens TaxID=358 RepID=A0AAP9E871_AGRTU|nr:glycogen debranching protein GlgX [Agrobacterium tumefaciens]NSZ60284.1 glycogen debranching protein GlgX [Agrobacterium tumefaciens]QDY96554.1 glycogen debranching protein GlgX [Agrobacterium tumefaciens]UXS46802.1 glycogen debranching protein GlgX [Agrobacterium tumefaciens]UXS72617.1 glycogen debranching protein GlgX [Agrobacterium tumefaciens]UXS80548.1 glycogen debranching protein GlgX [Agrobacterium tumefaciens]